MPRTRQRIAAALATSALIATSFIAVGLGASSATAVQVSGGSVVSVEAGTDHTCVVKTGPAVECWGKNATGVNVPDATPYIKLAAGAGFTCGIEWNSGAGYGDIDCWGIINGSTDTVPAHVEGEFDQISAGSYHVCARDRTSWAVTCWGDDWAGRADPPAGTQAYRLAAGEYHTCAIIAGGALDCWGNDYSGTEGTHLTTGEPTGDFEDVTSGAYHSCALRDSSSADPHTAVCWGFNPDHRADAPAGVQFFDIESAGAYNCGILRSDRTLQCWGATSYFPDPLLSPPTDQFQSLSGGFTHMCGLTTSAVLKCWGDTFNSSFIPGFGLDTGSATAGSAYTGTISGTYIWPKPSWSVTGALPAGITLNSATGVLSGTTTVADYFPIHLATTSMTIPSSFDTAISVTAGALASLDVQVDDATVTQGDSVNVDVWQYDTYGNFRTNYSPDAVLSSDDADDTWSGNQVSFPFDPADPVTVPVVHTITATMGAITATETVTVDPITDAIQLTAAPTTATVGDTITVGASAENSAGDPIADISDYITVTSDVPEDVVDGKTVTFTHASPHTITVSYGTLSTTFLVEVSPAATPADDDDPDGGLAFTGLDALPYLLLALALFLIGGVLLLVVTLRRRHRADADSGSSAE